MFLVNLKELNSRKRSFNNPGSQFSDVYEEHIDESGEWCIRVSCHNDLRHMHQEGLEASKPINIMKRVELGDVGVLTKMQGIFADMTGMPKTLIDAHNSLLSANSKFYSLPVEVRALFNNSIDKFFNGLSDGSSSKVIDDYLEKLRGVPEKSEKEEVSE